MVYQRLTARDLERACWQAGGLKTRGKAHIKADQAVAEILNRVGQAGSQAQADEQRYFETYYDRSKRRAPIITDVRDISFAAVASDYSAAILSFVEYGSFLRRHENITDGWGGLHHLRFAVYLVVRDATSGNRHIIRIPPRFGRYMSREVQFRLPGFCRSGYRTITKAEHLADLDSDMLIRAATAWTFDLHVSEYRPEVAA